MKKIYLDWNIINHIDEDLYEFILENQNHFVFVYSPAHFSDLMRSLKGNEYNKFFEKDIEKLGRICETHLMKYDSNKINLYCCPPTEFLEKEGKNYPTISKMFNMSFYKDSLSLGENDLFSIFCDSLKALELGYTELPLIGSFSNGLEFFQCLLDFIDNVFSDKKKIKEIKTRINKDIPQEIACINNNTPQMVMDTINSFFRQQGINEDLKDFFRKGLSETKQGNDMLVFQSLYLCLDFFNFHSDKTRLWNIMTDAEHAYYGSYCDVLVTNDEKMKLKTQAMYSYYGITTEIVCSQDLLDYLKKVIADETDIKEPLSSILSNQHIPTEFEEDSVYCKWTRLNNPTWGYFNKLEYFLNLTTKQNWFTFSWDREFEKCTFYTEIDKFLEIFKVFLYKPEYVEEFEAKYVAKFKAKDPSALFCFGFSDNVQVLLSVTEEDKMIVPIMDLICIEGEPSISA